ncbi:MAG: sugar phosphate isomerase/epimerase, partial [Bacteroidota bacterium]
MSTNRRAFLQNGALLSSGLILSPWILNSCAGEKKGSEQMDAGKEEMAEATSMFFNISLAQWSLHKALFSGKIDNLDFPAITKNEFGIEGVEFVNQFFKDKAKDEAYLGDLKTRCSDNGVTPLIIMIDGEGGLGGTDDAK